MVIGSNPTWIKTARRKTARNWYWWGEKRREKCIGEKKNSVKNVLARKKRMEVVGEEKTARRSLDLHFVYWLRQKTTCKLRGRGSSTVKLDNLINSHMSKYKFCKFYLEEALLFRFSCFVYYWRTFSHHSLSQLLQRLPIVRHWSQEVKAHTHTCVCTSGELCQANLQLLNWILDHTVQPGVNVIEKRKIVKS